MAWTSPPLRGVAAAALALALVLSARAAEAAKAAPPGIDALPDIFGPGAVLRAGQVHMKVTNFGHVGNILQNQSSDPAGQWPGESGIEYLHSISLAVGAKDATAVDPNRRRRVSYLFNWRPPSLDAVDRIYAASDTSTNGARFVNDDLDADEAGAQRIDEDFLDGRDNDGDGRIDEDFAGIGDQMYSLVMRDNTPQAMAADSTYLPLGLECRQVAWAYSRPDFGDFCAVEYTIFNRSGHTLDSVFVGWGTDLDCGPASVADFFTDDRDAPGFPSGEFVKVLAADDTRRQFPHAPAAFEYQYPDSALCPRLAVRVNGFSVADDDGDSGRTPGIAMFLLVEHTTDPRGITAPARTGFRAFRSFPGGTPYAFGGAPVTSDQRYEFMSGTEHVDSLTGFIDAAPGASSADYRQWCSIGPFRHLADGASVRATILFAVQKGGIASAAAYAADYAAYQSGALSAGTLFTKHPALRVAFDAQLAYEGRYELNDGYPAPDFHGRETALRLPAGNTPMDAADCHDRNLGQERLITDLYETGFDFDCDYCTGVWDFSLQRGLFHHTWALATPLLEDAPSALLPAADVRLASANPAVADAQFAISSAQAGRCRLAIFDPAGRRVRVVADAVVPAGRRTLRWDLRDETGARVRAGLYFFRAQIGELERAGTVVVLR